MAKRKGIKTAKLNCPNCGVGNEEIASCRGGTNWIPNPKIKWICKICLWEW